MARRRHYSDIVALPLSGALDTLKGSAKGTDILVGAAAGIAGFGALNWLKNQSWFPMSLRTNAQFVRFTPLAAGTLAAVAIYFADKKVLKMPGRAAGHAVGAFAAGLAVQALQEAKTQWPVYFSDIVDLRLAGLIVNDPMRRGQMNGYGSFLIDDPARPFAGLGGYADNPNLADLASMSLGLQEDDPDLQEIGIDS